MSSLPFPCNFVRNFPRPPSLILNALAWARTSIRVDEMGGSQGVPQVGLHTFLVWKVVGETAILLPPEQLQALVKIKNKNTCNCEGPRKTSLRKELFVKEERMSVNDRRRKLAVDQP